MPFGLIWICHAYVSLYALPVNPLLPTKPQSMYFSNFVASKLNVWNSNGRHRLEEFLAKMGFSLEQCKQKYPFMSCQLRKRLRDQIEKYADDYGLQDVFYGKRWCLKERFSDCIQAHSMRR